MHSAASRGRASPAWEESAKESDPSGCRELRDSTAGGSGGGRSAALGPRKRELGGRRRAGPTPSRGGCGGARTFAERGRGRGGSQRAGLRARSPVLSSARELRGDRRSRAPSRNENGSRRRSNLAHACDACDALGATRSVRHLRLGRARRGPGAVGVGRRQRSSRGPGCLVRRRHLSTRAWRDVRHATHAVCGAVSDARRVTRTQACARACRRARK